MLDFYKVQLMVWLLLVSFNMEKQKIFGQTTRKYLNSNSQYNGNQYNQNNNNRVFGGQYNTNSYRPQQKPIQQQLSTGAVNCPERNIRLETADCNSYIECSNGNGTIKVCPDGLFYNTNASFFTDPCSYDIQVDCGNRNKPPSTSTSELCPYENGYFLPDKDKCNRYVVCTHGMPHNFECPKGLAFDEKSYTCRWPDEVPNCDSSKYLGVTCPPVGDIRNSLSTGFDKFPYGDDCMYYYICIRDSPRLLSCPANELFNPDMSECESAANFTCGSTGRSSPAIDSRSFANQNSNYRNNYQNINRNQQPQFLNRNYQNSVSRSSPFQSQPKRRFRRRLVKRIFKNGIKISESFI